VFPAIYLAVLGAFCVEYGIFPSPEWIAVCFFIYAAYHKWSRRFIKDWIPFVGLFVCYEAMNGMVGGLGRVVHVSEPMDLELRLFGSIPTLVLQEFYRTPFLDYLSAFLYSLHFIAPTIMAFLLWKYRPENFNKYVLAIGIGTYSALITFLVYPVAPPWFGAGATRVLLQVDQNLGIPFYRTLFDFVESNPFAAFPSLHAMYPWIIFLFALKIKKIKALPVLLFPVGVWFSAVYLGEHYIIDLIGGIVYGTCAFFLADKLVPLLIQRFGQRAKFLKPQ